MTLQEIAAATSADGSSVKAEVFCQVLKAREGVTRQGKPFLEMEIGDGTATEKFKVWEDNPSYDSCAEVQDGDCVKIDATFFRNQFGMNVDGLRLRWLEKQEISDLFAGTAERRAALERDWADVERIIGEIKDPRLRLLCETYLAEFGEKFKRAAAARDYHHARRGGLLEHTAQMLRSGRALAAVYGGLNWDLVIAGVLFHDSGKLWELDYQPQGFVSPMTTMGELLGHITIGIELVNKLWRQLEANPDFAATAHTPAANAVREHLLHLIASHHGQKEYGAPVTPRTPEAWMLHHIDNIDAHLEMLAQTYRDKSQIFPGIYDYRRPLEGRAIAPLPGWIEKDALLPGDETSSS